MDTAGYPDELKAAFWEKKKGAVPSASGLADKMKALQRKHEAVDWAALKTDKASTTKVADVDALFNQCDRLYRAKVLPLKFEAAEIGTLAQGLQKDKASGKPQQDAGRQIAAETASYAKAIEAGLDELQSARTAAQKVAAAAEAKAEDQDDTPTALVDPKRTLQALQACVRDAAVRVQFAFVPAIDKEKKPATFIAHARTGGKTLFTRLLAATGQKQGSYGEAWIADKMLMLQPEKPFSGLAKKAKVPVKACGLRVADVRLVGPDGKEIPEDDDPADATASDGTPPIAPPKPPTASPTAPGMASPTPATPTGSGQAEVTTRLKALMAKLDGAPVALKVLVSEIANAARDKDWPRALTLLERAEAQAAAPQKQQTSPPPSTKRPIDGRVLAPVFDAWRDASETVDQQIARLQDVLKRSGDEDLSAIAEFGLNALTGNHKVKLMSLVAEARVAQGDELRALATKGRRLVNEFRRHVDSNAEIAAVDANPFGVNISIRGTLGKALTQLGTAFDAAARQ